MKTFHEWLEEKHPDFLLESGMMDRRGAMRSMFGAAVGAATTGLLGGAAKGADPKLPAKPKEMTPEEMMALYAKVKKEPLVKTIPNDNAFFIQVVSTEPKKNKAEAIRLASLQMEKWGLKRGTHVFQLTDPMAAAKPFRGPSVEGKWINNAQKVIKIDSPYNPGQKTEMWVDTFAFKVAVVVDTKKNEEVPFTVPKLADE